MEKKQIKNYIETLQRSYLKTANEALNNFKEVPADQSKLKEFYLKESTEFLNKSEALIKVLEFINSWKMSIKIVLIIIIGLFITVTCFKSLQRIKEEENEK